MPRATPDELKWAYFITNAELLRRGYERGSLSTESWKTIQDEIFNMLEEKEFPTNRPSLNEMLEKKVEKYLHPSDDFISLTDIAKQYDAENPNYLIQSWLRSRNTVEFLAEWERQNNPQFDEEAFAQLLVDVKSPAFTLTPTKWMEAVGAIGLSSKRGKGGGTMAHPFIACDFEMWNDMTVRCEVIKRFVYANKEK